MNTLTSNFRTTEEFLSSSPGYHVSTIAVSAANPLRCAEKFAAERLGANGFATMTTSISR